MMQTSNIKKIAQKELLVFFSSLTAFIFFAGFLASTLFIFFWVDTFFARNIADVRPMFEWMPVLFVFLVPALTMRMWSEERRSGTLEFLLTVPMKNMELVAGKFVACLALVLIALALTLPIPISVGLFLGDIDFGPVAGGYVASVFLAAAYIAIGLYVSARTDNQIVSLLLSTLLCGTFLLIGNDSIAGLFSSETAELMKLVGSGSRFQSITRGVIDFRDLYYYVSIAGVFLALNCLELEKIRWAGNQKNSRHNKLQLLTWLILGNLIAGNFWLQQLDFARVDLTAGHVYTLSRATKNYLASLKEPLLIRGYFSKKTHSLLAPLAPRLKDLLKEYALAGNGKVKVEFIDPAEKPELEKEAGEKYGIKPVVLQSSNKYQASLTNSYFDVLIKYGDQFEKLGFRDLIEVKARNERDVKVDLRNPEYDITTAIKKVLYSYQGAGNIFAGINQPITFTGYISADSKLPEPIVKLKGMLQGALKKLQSESNGKLIVEFKDPEADGGKTAKQLETEYGFRPMAISLFDPRTFWFYMTLKSGNQFVPVAMPDQISQDTIERNINTGLKKFSKGFLKTIGFFTSKHSQAPPMGMMSPDQTGLSFLKDSLAASFTIEQSLFEGQLIPPEVDLLLIVAPEKLSQNQVFAVDQFLMKGGTVILCTSPFDVSIDHAISCREIDTGLENWLSTYGVSLSKALVLDEQNFPLPIPVRREIRGFTVEETQQIPYPYFVDIRSEGMPAEGRPIIGVDQVVMNWAAPIMIDGKKNEHRKVITLLQSSNNSWTSAQTKLEPNFTVDPNLGFPKGGDIGHKVLGCVIEGEFESLYKGRPSPMAGANDAQKNAPAAVIEKSPPSARIILFSSASCLSDKMLILASESVQSRYIKPVEMIQNAIDWSIEDRDLL
ncbi:MAG TPA: Gldg family protein, partial [Chroococcales cyanobacterium]